ncbi:MAG: glycosyltransferase family 87 protein [Pseudomonadota bacterium]
MLNSLVNASWVDEERLKVYPLILVGMLAAATAYVLTGNDGLLPNGNPFGSDFVSFWVAAREALVADPTVAYARETFEPIQQALFPEGGFFAFFYPPHFQLMLLPLGGLSFFVALIIWLAVTFALVAWVMVKITGNAKLALLLAIAFPAAFLNISHGQNAFLTAGLFATGLYLLPSRPVLAGVFFGVLTFKPQLGVLIPVALLAAGQWRTIFSAAITTLTLVATSALVLGVDVWSAFLAQTQAATDVLEHGSVGFAKMISVYSGLRAFDWAHGVSMTAHVLITLGVVYVIWRVWRPNSGVSHGLRCALIMSGALIVTPFGLNYDLYLLAPAAAFFVSVVAWQEMDGIERNSLIAGFFLPLTVLLTMTEGYSLAPWIVLLVFASFARRALGRTIIPVSEGNRAVPAQ